MSSSSLQNHAHAQSASEYTRKERSFLKYRDFGNCLKNGISYISIVYILTVTMARFCLALEGKVYLIYAMHIASVFRIMKFVHWGINMSAVCRISSWNHHFAGSMHLRTTRTFLVFPWNFDEKIFPIPTRQWWELKDRHWPPKSSDWLKAQKK